MTFGPLNAAAGGSRAADEVVWMPRAQGRSRFVALDVRLALPAAASSTSSDPSARAGCTATEVAAEVARTWRPQMKESIALYVF